MAKEVVHRSGGRPIALIYGTRVDVPWLESFNKEAQLVVRRVARVWEGLASVSEPNLFTG